MVSCSPWGCKESDTTEWLHFHFSSSCIGEGNGNPLQCSCLETLRDSRAWWAAVYGVLQSRTWLKRFSSSSSRWYSDKESAYQCRRHRRLGSISGSGRSPGGGSGNPPTAVFLPGKFHGQRSLAGYTVHGVAELDMTEHIYTLSLKVLRSGHFFFFFFGPPPPGWLAGS